jgi:hypothetical protein
MEECNRRRSGGRQRAWGGRGGAYGLEDDVKEKQTFSKEDKSRKENSHWVFSVVGFFDLVDEGRIRVINEILMKGEREQKYLRAGRK